MNKAIETAVKEWADTIVDVIGVDEITETLYDCLTDAGVYALIEVEVQSDLKDDMYAIGGAFDPSDPFNEIALTFYFSSEIENGLVINDEWLTEFCREVVNVAIHEYRHWQQDQIRGDTLVTTAYRHADNRDQRYLGDSDEVDAYAIGIAYTLKDAVGTEAALDILRYSATPKETLSADLVRYADVFTSRHAVYRRLVKKVAMHLTAT